MFDKILVPLDGSPNSESILARMGRLLTAPGTRICLMQVVHGASAPTRDYLHAVRDRLREEGLEVEIQISKGDPAEQILKFATRYPPKLIAMSTHGRSGWARAVRGSVAERILRHGSWPLLLVRPESLGGPAGGEFRFDRILVPLDGSEASSRVLPLVEELAKRFGSEVVLEHAASTFEWVGREPGVTPESMLEPARTSLVQAGVRCRIRVDLRDPPEAIQLAAEEEAADLIALATHGRSGAKRWAFGSVTEGLLRQSDRPVLVVRSIAPARRAKRSAETADAQA